MSSLVSDSRLLSPAGPAQTVARYGSGFALFLLVNATLFVRPAEIFPSLLGWQIYLFFMLLCLAISFSVLFEQLQPASLERQPITVCVLALLPAIVLSQLSHARVLEALDLGWDFIKTLLYYFLLVGLVTTRDRLRLFLFCLVLLTTTMAGLAVLQYHGFITLENLNPIKDSDKDLLLNKEVKIIRLVGTGLFHDPNEFALPVVIGMLLTLYWLSDRRLGMTRFVLLGPLLLLAYTLALTQSRGGMLAFMIGVLVFLRSYFGGMLSMGLAGVIVPGLLILFGGRQTNFEARTGTSMERVELWSDALMQFRQSPLFGIGRDEFKKVAGLVAHNSFMHAFAEMGFFGGMFYLGAFLCALYGLYRLGKVRHQMIDPELRRLQPFLLAVVAATIGSMMSLSMCYYVVPTYTVLGLSCCYVEMARTNPPQPVLRFDTRLLVRFVQASIGMLIFLYVVVRLFRGG